MSVLIFSQAVDVHATAVTWALGRHNVETRLVCQADFPELFTASVWFDPQHRVAISEPEHDHLIGDVDVVWYRRITSLTVPEGAHPADAFGIQQQGLNFLRSLHGSSFQRAFWINSYEAHLRGINKLLQLQVAGEVGLRIPRTLISNRPEDVRAFLAQKADAFIAKPLSPLNWHGDDYLASAYTSHVTLADCADDQSIQWLPMIYQGQVRKAFELRVVVMGRSIFAAKIFSQELEDATLDWRIAQERPDLRYEPYVPSDDLRRRLLNLMDRLGLVFGSIDLIVDPDGEVWFLEVNEQGQFLFVEDRLPELPLLDAFAHFCISAKVDFVYAKTSDPATFSDFIASPTWQSDQTARLKLHNEYTPRISERE